MALTAVCHCCCSALSYSLYWFQFSVLTVNTMSALLFSYEGKHFALLLVWKVRSKHSFETCHNRLDSLLVPTTRRECISGDRHDRLKPFPARGKPRKSALDVTWVISADSIAEVIIYFTCINPRCVTDTVEPSTFIGIEIRRRHTLRDSAATERRVRCPLIIYSAFKLPITFSQSRRWRLEIECFVQNSKKVQLLTFEKLDPAEIWPH